MSTLIASLGAGEHEGPVVAPTPNPPCPGFGTFGGQILVADEEGGGINAIGPPPTYTVTHNIFDWPNGFQPTPEALAFVPCSLCTYCGYAFFQTSQQSPALVTSMFAYLPGDFLNLADSLLVTLESDQRIVRVAFQAGNYATTVFDTPPALTYWRAPLSLTATSLRLHRLLHLLRPLRRPQQPQPHLHLHLQLRLRLLQPPRLRQRLLLRQLLRLRLRG